MDLFEGHRVPAGFGKGVLWVGHVGFVEDGGEGGGHDDAPDGGGGIAGDGAEDGGCAGYRGGDEFFLGVGWCIVNIILSPIKEGREKGGEEGEKERDELKLK